MTTGRINQVTAFFFLSLCAKKSSDSKVIPLTPVPDPKEDNERDEFDPRKTAVSLRTLGYFTRQTQKKKG
jgi:hypothetical protein